MTEGFSFGHFRVATHPDGLPIELGRGAMGVTYKAHDERLRIDVALKVIRPSQIEDARAQALFLREARAAARVHHANVASVVFLSDTPGNFFYAMEFVAGVPLQDWLRRRGALPPDMALGFAAQIALGLAAIHGEQIVHRDLKPANLMIVEAKGMDARRPLPREADPDAWQIKIIDFGLARAFAGEGFSSSRDAQTIGFRGTALYASPEQCEENARIDGRSDQYALGCILWEMLVGKPPFSGRNHRELLNQHVAVAPPLERIRHLPAAVQAVVARMLLKDPAVRFADDRAAAAALEAARMRLETGSIGESIDERTLPDASLSALERGTEISAAPATQGSPGGKRVILGVVSAALLALVVGLAIWIQSRKAAPAPTSTPVAKAEPKAAAPSGPARPATSRKSVAVLPFANLSADKENEYFADGVHEDLLTNLSRIRDLKVISRTSVMGYRGKTQNLRQIAGELGVATIVEGSVRRAGDKIRVAAQLIDANTDERLWAETFDGDLTDIFSIQSKIAQDIAKALAASLSARERSAIEKKPTENPLAYEYYLRGREVEERALAKVGSIFDVDGGTKAIEEMISWYQKAVAEDPDFAQPYANLASLNAVIYRYGNDQTPGRAKKTREAALAAMRANPDLAEAHVALGIYNLRIERDYRAALGEFRKAQELSPNYPDAYEWAASPLWLLGQWEEAVAAARRYTELAPKDPYSFFVLSLSLEHLGRWEEAEKSLSVSAALTPDAASRAGGLARIHFLRTHDFDAYRAAMQPLCERLVFFPREEFLRLTRQFEVALGFWESFPGEMVSNMCPTALPSSYFVGYHLRALGRPQEAEKKFREAALLLERDLRTIPDDGYKQAFLALTYAGLGQTAEAVREGQKALESISEKNDALHGRYIQALAAEVYARVGKIDKALDILEHLVTVPVGFSLRPMLPYDPAWDSLRGHPRFEKLIAETRPITSTPAR